MAVNESAVRVNYTGMDTYVRACFYHASVILPIIGCLGICGNILSIRVLRLPGIIRETTRLFLLALAFADTGFLACFLFCLMVEGLGCYSHFGSLDLDARTWSSLALSRSCVFIITNIIGFASYQILMAVTIDRYLVIRHPVLAQKYSTASRTKAMLVTIGVASTVSALPIVFESSERAYINPVIDGGNSTIDEPVFISLSRAALETYNFSSMVIVGGSIGFVLVVISVFNGLLMVHIQRKKTQARGSTAVRDRSTVVLVAVVSVLTLCSIPTFLYRLHWLVDHDTQSSTLIYFRMFSGSGFVINSSVNFIIYVVVVKKFRRALATMFPFSLWKYRRDGLSAGSKTSADDTTL